VNVVEPSAGAAGSGAAAELAATVAFLCSNGAAYLSGAIIPLDGQMATRRIG
jgi:NAD(P)-dependent dehydrogenase (short-subunit alcohol dehydrogenase family)